MIFVVDDDEIMAGCVAGLCRDYGEVRIFSNAIMAMQTMDELGVPDLIFLDVLLDGPDGFTFLNELVSFPDTAKVPVVLVTSLDLVKVDLADYGVVQILKKDTMVPAEIKQICERYAK